MTSKDYRRPTTACEHEIEIKSSRFIACLSPCRNTADAAAFLAEVQKRWPKANHYCTAHVIGSPFGDDGLSCSDDGEPSGTAGRPMLNVLRNAPLGDISVVVVRYFGGIKLGTGGLQRAYSQAVSEALTALETELCIYRQQFRVNYPYSDQGAIDALWKQYQVQVLDSDFTELVSQHLATVPENVASLQEKLNAATQGRIKLMDKSKEHGAGLE
ncbi:YigZ family protein [Idiomarina seosinensis]|uniref:YigZ family protein n=1 Tax=Idiomarina seosinensis TaxID=281739 RepID=UPI00384EED05